MKNLKTKSFVKVFAFARITLIAFSSCRKNRTCVCTDTQGETITTSIPFSKKKDAEDICNSFEDSSYPSCELAN